LTLEPGFRLDRYELLCPIAQGGMAQVWLARLHGTEKLVAVKTILSQYATDLRFQQMFLDEARIASGIGHPNVAQIFDLGEHGDLLFLVMEWVDGESLSQLVRASERDGKRIPIGIVARVCADACAGLHAAHELADKDGNLLHVVHRDVSPQNVLVSVKGAVKLIDFGLAKARDRVTGETSTGMFKGKILYMAPEQAMSKPVDRRADLWAVGAMLYHMLAGRPAYGGDSQTATLQMLTDPNLPFDPLPDEVPAALRAVVARALFRDPDKRIGTALELGNAIEAALRESKLGTTSRDVAKYVVDQLKDRNEARRKVVDLALQAAEQRKKPTVTLDQDNVEESAMAPVLTSADAVESLEPPSLSDGEPEPEPESLSRRRSIMLASVVGVLLLLALGVAISHSGASAAAPLPSTTAPPPHPEAVGGFGVRGASDR